MTLEESIRVEFGMMLAEKRVLSNVDDRGGWFTLYDYGTSMTAWQKDMVLETDGVLSNPVVFACTTLIASDISKCNIRLVERRDDIWAEAVSASFSPVLRKPNRFQNAQQFLESWVLSKLIWGNTYVLKQRDNRDVVVAEYVLDPCRVLPLVSETGEVFYQLNRDNLSGLMEDYPAVPASEIIHDRFNCLFHPLVGLPPLFASSLAATQGVKIQANSSKFFENMSRPSGILTAPGAISKEKADALRDRWEQNYGGDKVGKVAVLGDDLKYQALGVTAVDSQVVEQWKASAETICSTYHVPPFKVGVGAIPAGQKVEDLNRIYYSDCLQVLMDQIQDLQTEGLGLDTPKEGRQYAVQFDLDDLLKMDTATYATTIKLLIDAAVMTPNEGRKRFNLPPVEGGDTCYLQQQEFSLQALAKRDAQEDPFSVGKTAAPNPAPLPEKPAPAASEESEPEEKKMEITAVAQMALRKALSDARIAAVR